MKTMLPRVALVLIASVLLPLATADCPDATRPTLAVAVSDGLDVVVSWVPGPEPVDYFNVYGESAQGGLSLLAHEVTQEAAVVQGGFQTYEVTAVAGGVESLPVIATGVICVDVSPGTPPTVNVGTCPTRAGVPEPAHAHLFVAGPTIDSFA